MASVFLISSLCTGSPELWPEHVTHGPALQLGGQTLKQTALCVCVCVCVRGVCVWGGECVSVYVPMPVRVFCRCVCGGVYVCMRMLCTVGGCRDKGTFSVLVVIPVG